jgi:nucleotide-binding universal stress UspA family protein
MKTIIISDIKSNSKSILPYGLNLARYADSEVDVVHVIDPRVSQANYSSYSDSQSITPGEPLGHEEMHQKEISAATTDLDKVISSEASRVNYPLKINTVVEVGSLTNIVEQMTKEEAYCIVVTSSEPDGYLFESKSEIYNFAKESGAMCILVPPGKAFQEYKKILHPVDFDSKELSKYSDLGFFFKAFDPMVNAVSVANGENYAELELKSTSWAKMAKDTFLPAKIRTNVLKGEDYFDTLINFSNRNEPDLIMLFQRKKNLFQKNFKTEMVGTIIEKTNIPVLFFYNK